MSKVWKWILGIVLVLAVVAIVAAGVFVWQNHMFAFTSARAMPFNRAPNLQRVPQGYVMPMRPGFNDEYGFGPMMRVGRRGLSPFFGGLFILGWIVRLGILGLLLYGAYWLGKRNARVAFDAKPAVASTPAAEPPAAPTPNAE